MEPAKLKKRPGAWEPYLFLAPAMLLLFIFKIYPIIISFAGSFLRNPFCGGKRILRAWIITQRCLQTPPSIKR